MKNNNLLGTIGAIWGIIGWIALLAYAVYKLSIPVFSLKPADLEWYHWLVLVLNALFLVYMKGVRGFQRSLAPRIVTRGRYLRAHPHLLWTLFAPLFCMGYFHIIRRKQIVTIVMTVFMVILIVIVRGLPYPWRGVLDTGILLALGWGIVQLVRFGIGGLTAVSFPYPTYIEDRDRE